MGEGLMEGWIDGGKEGWREREGWISEVRE